MPSKPKKKKELPYTSRLGDGGISKLESDAAKTEDIRENLGFSPEEINELFDQGIYPYRQKVSRQAYEEQKRLLQSEL